MPAVHLSTAGIALLLASAGAWDTGCAGSRIARARCNPPPLQGAGRRANAGEACAPGPVIAQLPGAGRPGVGEVAAV